MTYNENSHINTIEDVQVFFHYLVYERYVNFHPDEDFKNYICYEDKTPTFSPDEVDIFDRLMNESFEVCSKKKQTYIRLVAMNFSMFTKVVDIMI